MQLLPTDKHKRATVLYGGFILLISYFTYVHGYHQPDSLFWDENYHIASAQKYLNGVFFMEPHPPLGKLLIALGEKTLQPNVANDQFIGTDYGRQLPDDFSFAGYRLLPTLLSWLIAPMLFAVFLLLTKDHLTATLFSFLYVFDNAVIVHSRSAMLEPPLLFFAVAMVLLALLIMKYKDQPRHFALYSALFGIAFAGIMTTKVNGLVMILLYPAILWQLWPNRQRIWKLIGISLLGFLVVYVSVWHTHFALGSRIEPSLPDGGYYQASDAYKETITQQQNASLARFPLMYRDSLAFLPHYAKGVPRLDLCKGDENGSPWFLWPLGARSINYRWETPDGHSYRYLYLQSNPVGWFLGMLGVVLSVSLLLATLLLPLKQPLKQPFELTMMLALYVGYMGAMSLIGRVMYLYHYFIPLVFSYILLCLAYNEIRQCWRWPLTPSRRTFTLLIGATCVFVSFQFYRPLTYYEPLNKEQFQRRNLLRIWDLKCVKCDKDSVLVRKSC